MSEPHTCDFNMILMSSYIIRGAHTLHRTVARPTIVKLKATTHWGRAHRGKLILIKAQFFALNMAAAGHWMRRWLHAIQRTTSGDLEADDCNHTICSLWSTDHYSAHARWGEVLCIMFYNHPRRKVITSVTIHFQWEKMTRTHTLPRSHSPHNVMHSPSYYVIVL